MKRRAFTKKCLVASAGLLSIPEVAKTAASIPHDNQKRIPKTDTHVHLFDLNQFAYPWLKNATEINRNFDLVDFKKASKRSNIDKIIFMESGAQAIYSLREAEWAAKLAIAESKIHGIIAKQDLSKGSAITAELEQLARLKLLKGIRGGFPKDAPQSSRFLQGLKLLADRNLTFDLLLSTPLLEAAALLAKKCPNNTFILDHIGNPNIKSGDSEAWKKGIKRLAELPNINCKISGVITKVGKNWTIDQIKPYVMHVVEQFGPDRLVYGGDWPVVLRADTYKSWSKAFEKLTRNLSQSELHKIYHLNADRIYNL